MIHRTLSSKLSQLATKFPIIALTGPRQSGKTTLVKSAFPKLSYVSLEDIDKRNFATQDPRSFLEKYKKGAIIDEAQRAPNIFSYLQTAVDQNQKSGRFILTGSQDFLLMENISQSLAGRIGILNLLPLSIAEINHSSYETHDLEEIIFKGLYPRIYDKNIEPIDWYPNYIRTYIERDVRQIKNIADLGNFHRFMKLCAGRTGQILNYSSLANDCAITHNTAKSWISILAASGIIFLLNTHHKNFNKRLIKMPKIYFYDTGLACYLLNVENKNQILSHFAIGRLFETLMISEIIKFRFNKGLPSNLYYWRDKTGHEIDCIYEKSDKLYPIEMKAGKTISNDMFKNLHYWLNLANKDTSDGYLLYGGDQTQKQKSGHVIGWHNIHNFLNKAFK